jgi:peptide/nickel transport system substrate-binding protein
MKRSAVYVAATLAVGVILGGCGSSSSSPTSSSSSSSSSEGLDLVTTTPPASGQVASITWNQQEEPANLAPEKSATQLESPAVADMCDSVIRQSPNFKYEPGLATSWSNPTPTTWVYQIRQGVKFWDGNEMTPEDVAFSLNRSVEPKVGSFWAFQMRNVKEFKVTGPHQVTMYLKRPDYLVNGELSTQAGAVSEKSFVLAHGEKYGAPGVGDMCTGPFEFSKWKSGEALVMVRNPHYWDTSLEPKVGRITWSFNLNESTATDALLNGETDGQYQVPLSGVPQLRNSSEGKLYIGKSAVMLDLLLTNDTGVLKSQKIREALSLAIPREEISQSIFQKTTRPSKALVADGIWNEGGEQFEKYFASIPTPSVNLARAKQLVIEAGSPKQVIRLDSEPLNTYKNLTNIIAEAGRKIGLNISVKVLPLGGINELYFDAKARKTTDAFVATWYTNLPEPLENLTYFLPGGEYNYGEYDNPSYSTIVEKAIGTANVEQRTALTIEALKLIDHEVPWIPIVELPNRLFLNKSISGATASLAYLDYPWAAAIGGTGQ